MLDLAEAVAARYLGKLVDNSYLVSDLHGHERISAHRIGGPTFAWSHQNHCADTRRPRGSRTYASVVRLRETPSRDEHVGPSFQGRSDEELSLPHLIAPEGKTGQIVTLDEDANTRRTRQSA
jgi:hypothetical protein